MQRGGICPWREAGTEEAMGPIATVRATAHVPAELHPSYRMPRALAGGLPDALGRHASLGTHVAGRCEPNIHSMGDKRDASHRLLQGLARVVSPTLERAAANCMPLSSRSHLALFGRTGWALCQVG